MSATVSISKIRSLVNDICSKLETAKDDFLDIKDDKNLPPAFAVVAKHLDLVQATLEIAKKYFKEKKPDTENGMKIQRTLVDGEKMASNMQKLFHSVASNDGTPLLERYPRAALKIGRGTRVELVMEGLLKDVKKVAESPAMKAATGVQTEALNRAIEEVSELEPSLEEVAGLGGPTVNVTGGVANSNFGIGGQYNNSGSGAQYNGKTQNFSGKVPECTQ